MSRTDHSKQEEQRNERHQRGLRLVAGLLAIAGLAGCIVLPVPPLPPRIVVIEPGRGHDSDGPREHRHRRDRHEDRHYRY